MTIACFARPLYRSQFNAYLLRSTTQEIALLRSQEVLETIQSHTNTTGKISNTSSSAFGLTQSLPEALAKLTVQWTGAHCVTLPHTTVCFLYSPFSDSAI